MTENIEKELKEVEKEYKDGMSKYYNYNDNNNG